MTPRALYAFAFLALLLVAASAFNVYLWDDSRTTRADLKAEQRARLSQREQDIRNANVVKVSQCRQSIGAIRLANTLIGDARAAHQARARQTERLAKVDPTAKLRRVHLSIAAQERAKAATLVDFPERTKADCDKLARRLGVEESRGR